MLYRLITESTNESRNDPIKELTDDENRILEIIKSGRRLTRDEMAQEISKSKATVQRCINSLLTKGYIKRIDSNKTGKDKILLMVKPDGEYIISIDETIIPHLEEYFGKKEIIYLPYDENKISSEKFLPMQYIHVLRSPNYFFKIEKNQ